MDATNGAPGIATRTERSDASFWTCAEWVVARPDLQCRPCRRWNSRRSAYAAYAYDRHTKELHGWTSALSLSYGCERPNRLHRSHRSENKEMNAVSGNQGRSTKPRHASNYTSETSNILGNAHTNQQVWRELHP